MLIRKSLFFLLESFHWNFINWHLVDSRIKFIQFQIISHPSIYNKSFNLQKFLFSNLSCRFKAVKETVSAQGRSSSFLNNWVLTEIEKFNLVLNLRSTFFLFKSLNFYVENVQSQCFLFSFSNIYEEAVEVMWNTFFITVLEFNIANHNSSIFRPFRNSKHCFFVLKNFFLWNKFFSWTLNFRFVSFLELSSSAWLLKNFPVKNIFLVSWFKKYSIESDFQLVRANLIFVSLVSFIINGFV
uniref:Putative reverse transcriptase n=1 Tax=Monomorphina aenigmatica TaxID=304863 RepID=L0BGQ1_MONAE|nr:putative reverse transcriptase [Monomorphina aenigmatica]AFZ88810.1 putative reverse transcriptase [Monomorphina aenigmatica]